jgi:leucyl/phenylalanyl-tRNA--protein transferase
MSFEYQFPDPRTADSDGLLAAGGDLSIESLVTAYSQGIFPWYDKRSPILWWSPDPRLILYPERFRLSDSLKQRIRSGRYEVKIDNDFETVIGYCAEMRRKGQRGTWITEEMRKAYIALHKEGLAHCFETWYEGEMAGGLYGVSLGRAFFGESMFHLKTDASKIALAALVQWSIDHEFQFIDAQQSTSHLKSMGAEEISRNGFLELLGQAIKFPTMKGKWRLGA